MTDILGIDLGTTKSVMAIWCDNAPHIILNAEGHTITPSVVALDTKDGQWQVGYSAQTLAADMPSAAIYSIKRFIGRRFSEDVVQESLRKLHIFYKIGMFDQWGGIEVSVGGMHLTPQEVSAKILLKLKADAEHFLGHEVRQAVISVPAYFHHSQRQATCNAARLAGLEVRRVLNEPTAACLAFGYAKLAEERKLIAVYDLGGGTFDISILEVGRGPFRVRTTNGNTFLGGEDLNWLIVDSILTYIGGNEQRRLQQDIPALARLRAAAEQAKVDLSLKDEVCIHISGPLSPHSQVCDLNFKLTRTELEKIARPFIEQTLESCVRALHDAHLHPSDIQEVLLVGGQTRMPAIREAVRTFFGIEPNSSINPEEVVALGASVQAAILAGEATGLKLADVVPLSLGVSTRGQMNVLIPRNTPVPYEQTKIYSTFCDNQESVEVAVYQGERPQVADNTKLGSFILMGIPPAPANVPEIEIKFEVDTDGILHVLARDRQTTIQKELTITDTVNLSEEQIAEKIRDAEEHAAEYAAQRYQADLRDQTERLAERLKVYLAEKKDTLLPETIDEIQKKLAAPPTDDWKSRLIALQRLWQRVLPQT